MRLPFPAPTGTSALLCLGLFAAGITPTPAFALQQVEEHDHPAADEGSAAPEAAATTNRANFTIAAARVSERPEIDGDLSDPSWERAAEVRDFVQQEPAEGEPATERTEVLVMYDGATLFFGLRAYDSDPGGVVATELRRDGNRILDEDNFQIILDTFMDSRSAYMFVVTPLGAMLDQQVSEEGAGGRRGTSGNVNRDWDGVWRASARRTSEGWTAEIAIPLVTLRFPATDTQSWGINFQRNVSRKNEVAFWAPIPRAFGLTRVSLAGTFTDLQSLSRGRDLRIKPYLVGGGRREVSGGESENSTSGDVGLDVKYGITAGLNLDLTVNTDFAQAEADDERVNLTRFALFFPEKRDFFLENAGQFNVGTTASLGRMADLFFSRQIGISESGDPVPIVAGARLTGKIGQHNIAVMDIQTDETGSSPGENFLVARYSRDVSSRSRVGALFVNRQATSGGHYNRTVAADLVFAPNASFTVNGFFAATQSPGVSGGELGGHLRAAWLDPSWNLYAEYTDLQDNFNPEVGFVPRVGIRTTKLHIERNPRPGRFGLRVLEPMWNVTYTTDQDGRLLSRQFHHMLGVRFDSGAYLNFWHNRYFERLDDPFRVASGVVIAPGAYHFYDWRVSYSSNPSRRVTYSVSWDPQTFYDGDRTDISLSAGVRITSQLATTARFTRNDVDLPAGAFVAEVGSLQLDYAFSPNTSLRTLTQYNSSNEQWSTSVRFRYIYRPGSDLYIVYDEVRRDVAGTPLPTEFRDHQLVVKMTYLVSL
ncbi:MAG: DUF5916 domain-containing protein [Gemmatimonadota bacterium]